MKTTFEMKKISTIKTDALKNREDLKVFVLILTTKNVSTSINLSECSYHAWSSTDCSIWPQLYFLDTEASLPGQLGFLHL